MILRLPLSLSLLLFALPILSAQDATAQSEAPQTIITSDKLSMESGEEYNIFHFEGNVSVQGNNLSANCDRMEVTSRRESEDADETIGELGAIKLIVAIGNVKIDQEGRTAEAMRAEIHPAEGYIHLIGEVEISNESGTVTGDEFIMEKGKSEARMIGSKHGGRVKAVLPGIEDLGPGVDSDSNEED